MLQAIAYLREGHDRAQEELQLRRTARANGIEIVEVFRDAMYKRCPAPSESPGLRQLIRSLYGSHYKTVVISSLDQLARTVPEQEAICACFQENSWHLIRVREAELQRKMDNRRTRGRMAARASILAYRQLKDAMVGLKLAALRAEAKERGPFLEGRRPYGFYDGEQSVLTRMKELRASGFGYQRIAAELNGAHIRPRFGRMWHANTIRRIVGR